MDFTGRACGNIRVSGALTRSRSPGTACRVGEFEAVGVPGGAPAFGHHLLIVDVYSLIARIIQDELVFAGLFCLDPAFVGDVAAGEVEVAREIHHMAQVVPDKVFEID